jgi:hypothetical protein
MIPNLPAIVEAFGDNDKRVGRCALEEGATVVTRTTSYLLVIHDCYWEEGKVLVTTHDPRQTRAETNATLTLKKTITNLSSRDMHFRCYLLDQEGRRYLHGPGMMTLEPGETEDGSLEFKWMDTHTEPLDLWCYATLAIPGTGITVGNTEMGTQYERAEEVQIPLQ